LVTVIRSDRLVAFEAPGLVIREESGIREELSSENE
jgi:hypothetical protein